MTKLSTKQKDFLRLILRSPDMDGHWREVSATLTPIAQDMVAENPELYETEVRDGVFHVRLSHRGMIVVEYL